MGLPTALPTPAGPLGPRVQPLAGVATVFDIPNTISSDLQRQAQLELDKLAPGVTTATLNIHTQRGVNLAIASRINDRMTVVTWIGKSGWDRPVREGWEGGVSVRGSWGR